MLQTKQKTGTTKRTEQNRSRTVRKGLQTTLDPDVTLHALLSGGRTEQIPAEAFFALSHRMGNAALTETLLRLRTGPELVPYRSAENRLGTEPFDWGAGPAEPPVLEAPSMDAPAELPVGLPAAVV